MQAYANCPVATLIAKGKIFMIPAAFEYYRPTDMPDVLALLQKHGDDARVIAGGHSLIPMMKLRLAEVPHLIDLQDLAGLSGISVEDTITLGAMATQTDLIDHDALTAAAPIVREAALQIADPQVRYMGTVGGNVANGDPGNDMPSLMQCLDAQFTVVGPDGERSIAAREFYEGAYMTAREDDEVLTSVLRLGIDYMNMHLIDDLAIEGRFMPVDGVVRPPDAPGLGITIDADKLDLYSKIAKSGDADDRFLNPTIADQARPGWYPEMPAW